MPTWAKVVIGIAIGSIVLCGGFCGVSYFFFKGKMDDLKKGAPEISADAKQFGANNAKDACAAEAISRMKQCGQTSVMCIGRVTLWMDQCLTLALPSPTLCEGVPAAGSPQQHSWQEAQCAASGASKDQRCYAVMAMQMNYCANHGGNTGAGSNEPTDDSNVDSDEPPTQEDDTK